MDFGKIFVVSGPAGVGKSTVCASLLEKFYGSLRRIITVTTRSPRVGEENGIDYHFINEPMFMRYVSENKFLEYANIHQKYFYGTPVEPVISNLGHGIDSLLIINEQGIESIRNNFRQLANRLVTIFVMPENMDVLTDRLLSRQSEGQEELNRRLISAKHEMEYAKNYDYIVLSGAKSEDFFSMQWIYEMESSVRDSCAPAAPIACCASQI